MLSHYHEAAYDAHMTGIAFMHIIKHKEIELARIMSRKYGNNKKPNNGGPASMDTQASQESQNPKNLKHQAVVLEGQYPSQQLNKMMMDASGTGRFYHLVPEQHVALV